MGVDRAGVLVHNGDSVCPDIPLSRTQDQQALSDLAEEAIRQAKRGNPIGKSQADILDEWAEKNGVPQHHQAYEGSGEHWPGGNYADHTHIYNMHVPYELGIDQ